MFEIKIMLYKIILSIIASILYMLIYFLLSNADFTGYTGNPFDLFYMSFMNQFSLGSLSTLVPVTTRAKILTMLQIITAFGIFLL